MPDQPQTPVRRRTVPRTVTASDPQKSQPAVTAPVAASPPQPAQTPKTSGKKARKPWEFGAGNKAGAGIGGKGKGAAKLQQAREAGLLPKDPPKDWLEAFNQAVFAADMPVFMERLMRHDPGKAATLANSLIRLQEMGVTKGADVRPVIIETRFPGVGAAASDFDAYRVAEENTRLKKQLEELREAQAPATMPAERATKAQDGRTAEGGGNGAAPAPADARQAWEDF